MPPLVKDYVEFHRIEYLPALSADNLSESVRTFLPTDNLNELLIRTLEAISKKLANHPLSPMDATSILLTGGHGVGKSHLLSLIYSLVNDHAGLAPGLSDSRIHSRLATLKEVAPLTIWLDLSEQTDLPLPELVLKRIHEEYQRRFFRQVFESSIIHGIETIKAHELITFNVAAERPILLMVDGLSTRSVHRKVQQLNEDIEFLSFIAYSSKSTQLFLLVAAHEDFFSPKSPLGIDATLMAQTLENFRIEWIDRTNLKEIICRHVLKKNSRQQLDLRKLYSFIKAKLPNFQYSENEFADTYPFHPLVFDLAEKLKGKIPSFSLLDFVMTTCPKVASRRAISLVTIDSLFDRMEFEIKTNPQCQRLYLAYQELASQAVLRLDDRWRLWGKMLLKASFLFTVADRAPSVRDLADALLLFEDSDTGLSYNVVGMILGQMERALPQGFTTTDDRLDRTYRLGAADLRDEINKYLLNIASQIPDDNPRLAEALLSAAQKHFPDWPLASDCIQKTASAPYRLRATWKGTERPGWLVPSHRFKRREYQFRPDFDDAALSSRLPDMLDAGPVIDGNETKETSLPEIKEEIEWVLWIEPLGVTAQEEEAIRPAKVTEIHWLPASPDDDQLQQLKRILALQLTEKSSSADFTTMDLASLREELDSEAGCLFRELYLNRAKIVTRDQTQAFNQGHLECRTFKSLLDYLFKPNFDRLYSSHPDFSAGSLSQNQIMLITRRLFASQDPTDREVQKLAGQFALPLGLVSRSEGLYELNLSITPPLFLSQVIQYLETLDTAERPVEQIFALVHRPPFGLSWTAVHLILTALVADGQIELFDPTTNAAISRENLASLESVQSFAFFKRIQTHKDYPVEVLTQWCRLITGKPDLTDISTSRGRNLATAALQQWLGKWHELQIPQKLDALPNEFLTTQTWRKMAWTKRRFEKLAELTASILANEIPLLQGIGKVIELFAENVGLLDKASRSLVELSHFLHWLERFISARAYLLSSEKTELPELENQRELLLRHLESIHDLLGTEKASQFESLFRNFKEQYVDYYATCHDQSVGPVGDFVLLDELESCVEFRNLQLLMTLPFGDSSYVDSLDEWIAAVRDYRCTLPVRDVLQSKPGCNCSFKLARPLSVSLIAKDLRLFLDLGVAHHREVLKYYRHVVEPQLVNEQGEAVANLEAIQSLFADGPVPELSQEIIEQINSFLDGHLLEEKLDSPLPLIAPSGRITKKELVLKIQDWLEKISSREDVLFTLQE